MLDENRVEALEGPEHGAVNHHRAVLRPVGSDVAQVETLRKIVVQLNRSQLPAPTDRVANLEVDLRPIEGSIAFVDLVLDSSALEGVGQRALRPIPHLVAADALLGPRRQLDQHAVELKGLIDPLDHLDDAEHLLLDLLVGAENVAVVLAEGSHPGETR